MKPVELTPPMFRGAVSLEQTEDGVKPWRIPYREYPLFPPDGLGHTAEMAAGVRMRFASDTTEAAIELAPSETARKLDLVYGDGLPQSLTLQPGESIATFAGLSEGEKLIELYLPQHAPAIVRSLRIEAGASWHVPEDSRPKWVAYGSSITQCAGALSPSRTWPALVARRFGLDLTCLGYGGNCHLEPMVARMIRDREADVISLCAGINIYGGGGSLSRRTFRAAMIGFVQIIREKHPDTPIALLSPIWAPRCEDTRNALGFTLREMRTEIEEAACSLAACGDRHVRYIDGLTIFGPELAAYLPDQLHPDGTGYTLMGQSVGDIVMEPLARQYGLGENDIVMEPPVRQYGLGETD